MKLGRNIVAGVGRAAEVARQAGESAHVQRLRDGLGELRALLADDGRTGFSIERFLLLLVRAVRSDDDDPLTDRDVVRAAKSRWRRARLAAAVTGPLAGAANHLVDLYCETATVADLDRLHGIGLADEEIAAVMLVLWNVTDDPAAADAAIAGSGSSVATILTERFRGQATESMPDVTTKIGAIRALWDARGLATSVRQNTLGGRRTITGIAFTGKRVNEFIDRASTELAVTSKAGARSTAVDAIRRRATRALPSTEPTPTPARADLAPARADLAPAIGLQASGRAADRPAIPELLEGEIRHVSTVFRDGGHQNNSYIRRRTDADPATYGGGQLNYLCVTVFSDAAPDDEPFVQYRAGTLDEIYTEAAYACRSANANPAVRLIAHSPELAWYVANG